MEAKPPYGKFWTLKPFNQNYRPTGSSVSVNVADKSYEDTITQTSTRKMAPPEKTLSEKRKKPKLFQKFETSIEDEGEEDAIQIAQSFDVEYVPGEDEEINDANVDIVPKRPFPLIEVLLMFIFFEIFLLTQ